MDDQQLILWALRQRPLVLAGAFGGDPGSAIALAVAAMTEPCLELVVTADEVPGLGRVGFVRDLLDALGRDDVAVASGQVIEGPRYWAAEGLVAANTVVPEIDLYAAVATMCREQPWLPVRYVGIGPMTDLAQLLSTDSAHPQPLNLASRLRIVQAGGALHTVDPRGAEWRFRRDPDAACEVVARAQHFSLIATDFTQWPITIRRDRLCRVLAGVARPWADLLLAHCDQWSTKYGHGVDVSLLDTVAVAAMVGRHGVEFRTDDIRLDRHGRIAWGPGHRMRVATGVDAPAIEAWATETLRSGTSARRSDWEIALNTLRQPILVDTLQAPTHDAAPLRNTFDLGERPWPHR